MISAGILKRASSSYLGIDKLKTLSSKGLRTFEDNNYAYALVSVIILVLPTLANSAKSLSTKNNA
jgi:hypothetical protein